MAVTVAGSGVAANPGGTLDPDSVGLTLSENDHR
jgi:hypothetical protein